MASRLLGLLRSCIFPAFSGVDQVPIPHSISAFSPLSTTLDSGFSGILLRSFRVSQSRVGTSLHRVAILGDRRSILSHQIVGNRHGAAGSCYGFHGSRPTDPGRRARSFAFSLFFPPHPCSLIFRCFYLSISSHVIHLRAGFDSFL